jgi:hypothetical protein
MMPVIMLPMIVVDGTLFEVTYHSGDDELNLEEVFHSRLQWEGNEGRDLNTIIDIVTAEHLDEFLDKRQKEIEVLSKCFGETLLQLTMCFKEKTEKYLTVYPGPRGVLGLPKILCQLKKIATSNKKLGAGTPGKKKKKGQRKK